LQRRSESTLRAFADMFRQSDTTRLTIDMVLRISRMSVVSGPFKDDVLKNGLFCKWRIK